MACFLFTDANGNGDVSAIVNFTPCDRSGVATGSPGDALPTAGDTIFAAGQNAVSGTTLALFDAGDTYVIGNIGQIAGATILGGAILNGGGSMVAGVVVGDVDNSKDNSQTSQGGTIADGEITGNVANDGGTISGGTIHGNVSCYSGTMGSGGGTISGGTIYGDVDATESNIGAGATIIGRLTVNNTATWWYSPASPGVAARASVLSSASNLGLAGLLPTSKVMISAGGTLATSNVMLAAGGSINPADVLNYRTGIAPAGTLARANVMSAAGGTLLATSVLSTTVDGAAAGGTATATAGGGLHIGGGVSF